MGEKRYKYSDMYFGLSGKFSPLLTFWKTQQCLPSLMKIFCVFFPFQLEALMKFLIHTLPRTLELLDMWESNPRKWQLQSWCGRNLSQPLALGRIYVFLNSKVVKILQTLLQMIFIFDGMINLSLIWLRFMTVGWTPKFFFLSCVLSHNGPFHFMGRRSIWGQFLSCRVNLKASCFEPFLYFIYLFSNSNISYQVS